MNYLIKKCIISTTLALFLLLQANSLVTAQGLPPLSVQVYDTSSSVGYYFLVPYTLTPPYTYDHAPTILDNLGHIVYYRILGNGGPASTVTDFKLHSNGLMSYFSPIFIKFYIMDSTFNIVDSLEAANGFDADPHEMKILPNGHYLLLASENRTMDLSGYNWFGINNNMPGDINASVKGSVIQEFDQDKNLIFEWKAFDNFEFSDVYKVWLNNGSNVDWTHSNALEVDNDGNILMSSRHLNEITKIDWQTGSIIWRMGGKNNQFNFSNDTIGFTGQHDIRRNSDGNLTLWDNGQYTNPPIARALEYQVDEEAKTATMVWEFINDSSMYSSAMGNQQQLPNGNRLIDFGFAEPDGFPMFTVVKSDYSKVMDVYGPTNYASYRAFNYQQLPWKLNRPQVTCQEEGGNYYLVAESGHPGYFWSDGTTTQSMLVTSAGSFQVFVPYGTGGYISSEIYVVDDPADPCHQNSVNSNIANSKRSINIYPNPVKNLATLSVWMQNPSGLSIRITDLLGNSLTEKKIEMVNTQNTYYVLDFSGFQSGIYLVSVSAKDFQRTLKVVH